MDTQRCVSFHLDEDVLPVDELKDCINEFFEMVVSASNDCSVSITWYAGIRQGSVALEAYPESESETSDDIDRCMDEISNDFKLLAKGEHPMRFSKKTLEHYNHLHEVACKENKKHDCAIIKVSIPGREEEPYSMAPINLQDKGVIDSKGNYQTFGTVFGEVVNIFGKNELYAVLYEANTDARIRVYFEKDMIEKVFEAFLHKAYVTGMISYDGNGSKTKIQAYDIELAHVNDNVDLANLFGILGDRK